jgi:catechol 2,3-dioxygenase-like lactoylglutathione lyase family enzyme
MTGLYSESNLAAVPVIHHTALCVRDLDASLRFWRDGLGFRPLMDETFEGDWPTLLRGPQRTLRSVFLGEPSQPTAGIVELVDLGDVDDGPAPPDRATTGFLLVSLTAPLDATLARLADLGLGGEPRRPWPSWSTPTACRSS